MNITYPKKINIGNTSLSVPIYFPSISSVKTAMSPQDYLKLLSYLGDINQQFLVSAFDLHNMKNIQEALDSLNRAKKAGIITLMDSGNYESFWKNEKNNWKQSDFHKILAEFPCDLAFSFDEQDPPNDFNKHIDLIVKGWEADQNAAKDTKIIPIIHAASEELPQLCFSIAQKTSVVMLAVPERRLGNGILERAQTIRKIKEALGKLDRYVALHLLGTGNPISITLYTIMGADSFDGLEWCQTVVDHETGLLYHFSQADFFAKQTMWSDDDELSFQARTLIHNLEFFSDWIRRLREAKNSEKLLEFCHSNLNSRTFQYISNVAGWD